LRGGAGDVRGAAEVFVPESAERLLKGFPTGTASPESIRKEITSVVESSLARCGTARNA
jgi:hypothetical protein